MPGMEVLGQWANYILTWIGFGTVVGLVAKAVMPGRDPGGALATVLLGVAGSVIGAGGLAYFSNNLRVSPLSPVGFVVAAVGSFFLLWIYRVLAGKLFREGETWPQRLYRGRKRVTVIRKD